MGYGMVKNLLKKHEVNIIAHKNRKPIEKLKKIGAKEIKSYQELKNYPVDCIMLCVTNTPIAIKVAYKIIKYVNNKMLVIDLTTHNKAGTNKMKNILTSDKLKYTVCPVMGGPVQSEDGVLGGIWGGDINNFEESKKYLLSFCKNVLNFGSIEKASKAKLLSNFLSLLTTTTVIEFFKSAIKMDIDLKLLCEVAKLGSGNSGALNRIADKAIQGDYKGYVFSVNNTLKDLTYINDLLSDHKNSEILSKITIDFYSSAKDKGYGDLLVSELIDKDY